jgi:shikimate kinase
MRKPKIFIFFGVPGSGKSYLGKKFAEEHGLFFYESDDDFEQFREWLDTSPKDKKEKIKEGFYQIVIEKIQRFLEKYGKLVVASALGTEKHRKLLLGNFGSDLLFILVKPNSQKHLNQVFERELKDPKNKNRDPKELKDTLSKHLEKKYKSFDIPTTNHLVVENNYDQDSETNALKILYPYLF